MSERREGDLVQNFDASPLFTSKYISGGMGHLNFMERIQQMQILIKIDLK